MGIAANPNARGVFYVKFSFNKNYDGIELYNFILGRISLLIGDILSFDFRF
jgi:hypothetical protein